MSKQIDDGGYAFGSGDMTHGGHPGMKLRDSFAGRCNIQRPYGWGYDLFKEPCPEGPESLGYSWSSSGGKPSFREDDPRYQEVIGYERRRGEHRKEVEKWETRRGLFADAMWRFAYADAMLAARKESPNDQP